MEILRVCVVTAAGPHCQVDRTSEECLAACQQLREGFHEEMTASQEAARRQWIGMSQAFQVPCPICCLARTLMNREVLAAGDSTPNPVSFGMGGIGLHP